MAAGTIQRELTSPYATKKSQTDSSRYNYSLKVIQRVDIKLTVDDGTDARHQEDTEYPHANTRQHTKARASSCFTICLS